jgi:ketosteroid isomerase-like protein
MSESPIPVVRSFFERADMGGIDGVLELLAPDAVLVVPPEGSAEPDTYRGHDGTVRDGLVALIMPFSERESALAAARDGAEL